MVWNLEVPPPPGNALVGKIGALNGLRPAPGEAFCGDDRHGDAAPLVGPAAYSLGLAGGYCSGEKGAGIRILFSWLITSSAAPPLGGQMPSATALERTAQRSSRLL